MLVAGCEHGHAAREDLQHASVGPVLLTELANIIEGMPELRQLSLVDGSYQKPARPVLPFTIIATALELPSDGRSVECQWNGRTLASYRVSYATASGRLAAQAELDELRDAGAPERDIDWYDRTRVSTDSTRPLAAVRFDETLRAGTAPLEKVPGAGRTYWAAVLCSDGNRTALLIDYVDAPLDGKGFLLVLERNGDHWDLIETQGIWIA
jgi:hypothetical protein